MAAEGQRSSRSILESLESRRLLANVGYAEIDFRMTGLVAHPTRNEVYLVGNDRKVRVVNTDSGNETRQITLPVVPGRAAVSPDGSILLVALPETKQVQVISLSTYTTTNVLDVGRPLIDVAVGVGNRFYGAWGT